MKNLTKTLPVIAIIGRPNVGKSTLFNRLTRSQLALVANEAGTTRDRIYGEIHYNDQPAILIDTAGVGGDETTDIHAQMTKQAQLAMAEADLLLLVVDGRAGLSAVDEQLALKLRTLNKPIILAINKMDGLNEETVKNEFYALGFNDNVAIAAAHGTGITDLLVNLFQHLPSQESSEATFLEGVKIAIVGRPNVGKSTLVNRLLGEERVLVFDAPGTTRDSIYIPLERDNKKYTLIDTAGVRRRRSIDEGIEKFSVIKTLQAIAAADVVVMVLNAQENISEQDLHLLGFILEAGKALVMVVNKWDGLAPDQREWVKKEIDRRLDFVRFARLYFISALHGTGTGNIFGFVDEAYAATNKELPTAELTKLLEKAVANHHPPSAHGKEIKLRYAHAGGHSPPIIVIHGRRLKSLPYSYQRYLMNFFREKLRLIGTPIRIVLKED